MSTDSAVFKLTIGVWLIVVIANLMLFGGGIWLIVHFARKLW